MLPRFRPFVVLAKKHHLETTIDQIGTEIVGTILDSKATLGCFGTSESPKSKDRSGPSLTAPPPCRLVAAAAAATTSAGAGAGLNPSSSFSSTVLMRDKLARPIGT
ncbi:hypothetical protein VTJ04DRAFT_3794 [Mycothermus thermophilus]|uniref:uncharacterized protein n=1 Tax=Humicola insolens TaxID=85995 RepID=UPI003741FDDD